MINAKQVRAARALLDWSRENLASASNISAMTVKNIENDVTSPRKEVIGRVQGALEEAGVEFLPGSGVRMRDASVQILHGNDGLATFLDDVFTNIMTTEEKEILIMGNSEVSMEDQKLRTLVENHVDRLNAAGVKEKILAEEGDTNFIAPWHWYRWLPKNFFTNSPFLIYGQKLGMIVWGPPIKITVLNDPEYTENVRKLFMFAWERATVPAIEEGKK